MIAILLALILRPVGFKFRSKVENTTWRSTWDWALFIGGFVPALIFGVAVGNVLLGVPFRFDSAMRIYYDGNFFGLLTPFALLCGLVSLTMLVAHGATVIVARVPGVVGERARSFGKIAALLSVVLFALAGVWLAFGINGYVVTSVQDVAGPSNPMLKTVTTGSGVWMENYTKHSWMLIAPVLGFAGMALSFIALHCRKGTLAFLCSSAGIFGIISTAGVSLFPFLLPSSVMPNASLTVWDASSSHLTLFIMLIATVIFLPLILLYTSWVYSVMRGPITKDSVDNTPNAY
jgi:cytochrome d ubiquinol oxidase subunit II